MSVALMEGAADVTTESDVALVAFVTDHYDHLFRVAGLICRHPEDAADAVQNALELAWRRRTTLREPERTRAWLNRIVTREAVRLSKARRSWLNRLFSPSDGVKWIEPADPTLSEPAARLSLRAGFARLSPDQRAVVVLHLHLGYSIAETAALVGAPDETVRSRLRVARQRLRNELEE